jgi:hypothetical protein
MCRATVGIVYGHRLSHDGAEGFECINKRLGAVVHAASATVFHAIFAYSSSTAALEFGVREMF